MLAIIAGQPAGPNLLIFLGSPWVPRVGDIFVIFPSLLKIPRATPGSSASVI